MKRITIILLAVLALTIVTACSNETNDITTPELSSIDNPGIRTPIQPPVDTRTDKPTIDEVHTEFLTELYQNPKYLHATNNTEKTDAAIETAKEIFAKYGVTPPSDDTLRAAFNDGEAKATQDPDQLVHNVLSPDEYTWWDNFATASVEDAQRVYHAQCKAYGAPEPGSMLDTVVKVSLSSAEFWGSYRANQQPKFQNAYVPHDKSWRNFIRFAVGIVVDGTCGGLAGAGTGWSGPGAAVVGGIVGGLASAGADHILFD